MKKLIQNRLHIPEKQRGNCFPTVIACFMDLDSPEDCIQIQEHYDDVNWPQILDNWLEKRGWELDRIDGHLNDGSHYLVTGPTIRGNVHVCIYKDGKLWHDPHPSGVGLTEENYFETLIKT